MRPISPPDSAVKAANFNSAQWVSSFSDYIKDDVYPELVNLYGDMSNIFFWLDAAKQDSEIEMKNRELIIHYEGSIETDVALEENAAAAGAAGDDITFRVAIGDLDTNGNAPVTVGEGILCPGIYQATGEDREYLITTVTKNSTTDVDVVCSPLKADAENLLIPAGTVLKIHGQKSGLGTGQPDGKTRSWFKRSFNPQITKTSAVYEGGIGSYQAWVDPSQWLFKDMGGGNAVATHIGQTQLEFDHMKRMADAVFFSEANENAGLTAASAAGGTSQIPSTKGIWNHAEDDGQDLTYSGDFSIEDMADVRDLLRAQLVTGKDVLFCHGSELGRMIEAAELNYIRDFSGGTDLMQAKDSLGCEVKQFLYNGVVFNFTEVADFNNPARYGNDDYDWTKRGLIYPMSSGKTRFGNSGEVVTPNIFLGYVNEGYGKRDRVFRVLDGMTGAENVAVTENDIRSTYLLSDFGVVVKRGNQLIRVLGE